MVKLDLSIYAALLGLIKSIPKGDDGDSVTDVSLRINDYGELEYKVEIEKPL